MSQHKLYDRQNTQNQNNRMSEDPKDGSRNSFTAGDADGDTPAEKKPPHDRQDQETIEARGKEGSKKAADVGHD